MSDSPADCIRVVIVDDHKVVCDGLRRALGHLPDIEIVGEAHTAAEALSVIGAEDPDVVVLDYRLPDADGIVVLDGIQTAGLKAKTLVLTGHDEKYYVRRALDGGAVGLLTKASADAETLAAAVRNCRDGVGWVSRDALDALRASVVPSGATPTATLTAREVEVLGLTAEGKTNAEIAASLYLSVRTVKYHMGNILSKTGARSRAEAVSIAFRANLIDIPS